ncbi:glycosyltransferase family 2 protein [Providencia rettgeri]
MKSAVICIVGYNRVYPLINLISSVIELTKNKDDIEVIVSLDYSDMQNTICDLLLSFKNNIRVIKHPKNLGLKKHIIQCGDILLNEEYKYLLLLEDDLEISPYIYDYIQEALYAVKDQNNIAGISLYSYRISEGDLLRFSPIEDGYDNYYLSFPSSWGQVWTPAMWKDFKDWFNINDCDYFNDESIPSYINNWPKSSWKKHFLRYMVHKNKYFFYPRISLTNNNGLDGQNHKSAGNIWQVPILQGSKKWNFSTFDKSNSIYNSDFNQHDRKYYYAHLYQKICLRYNENPFNVKSSIFILILSIKRKFDIFLKRFKK